MGCKSTPGTQRAASSASVVDGENHFEIAPGQAWDVIRASRRRGGDFEEPAGLLYHGSLALRSERELGRRFASSETQTDAPCFVDINLRDPWWTKDKVDWCLSNGDWVKLNDDELSELTSKPTTSFEDCRDAALGLAREHSIDRVIVTRGSKGALSIADGKDTFQARAAPLKNLIDTVGAGDAFSAVVCLGLLQEWGDQVTLDRAAAFAADLCGIRGATTTDFALYERHLTEWSKDTSAGTISAPGAHSLYILSTDDPRAGSSQRHRARTRCRHRWTSLVCRRPGQSAFRKS